MTKEAKSVERHAFDLHFGKENGSVDRSWMGNWRSDPPGAWRRKLINEKWRRRRTRVKVDTRANVSKVV